MSFFVDLAEALSQLKKSQKLNIPLVVFGHMHKQLANGNGLRKMIVVDTDNTIYLNGAIVPRIRPLSREEPSSETEHGGNSARAFTMVEIVDGKVAKIAESWVLLVGEETRLEKENILFRSRI